MNFLEKRREQLKAAKTSKTRVNLVGTVSLAGPYGFYLAEGEPGFPEFLGYGDSDGVLVSSPEKDLPPEEWVKFEVVEVDESTWD